MKKKILIKKLIIISIAWLALLCAALGGYFWLMNEIEYYEKEAVSKSSLLEANLIQKEIIAKNIKQSEDAEKLFDNYSLGKENDRNEYRKNALVRALGEVTEELQTVKMFFIMNPFEAYKPIPSTEGIDITSSKISMEFKALSDIAAFQILNSLQKKLKGEVYFKDFKVTKLKDIDSSVLLDISNGSPAYLVSGNIEFDWIQLRVEPSQEKEKNEPANPEEQNTQPSSTPANSDGGQDV